jgi:DNA-damage-inducible protein J
MITKETFVRARVDSRLKKETEKILDGLGLTTAEAIRIYLHQIRLHKGLPFELRLTEDNSDLLLPAKHRQAALDVVYDA